MLYIEATILGEEAALLNQKTNFKVMYPLKLRATSQWLLSSSSAGFHEKPAISQNKTWLTNNFPYAKQYARKSHSALSISNALTSLDLVENQQTERINSRSAANACALTPLGFLERAAIVYGDCPSIVYDDTSYTWSETHTRCLRLASSIVSLGIERGEVVSVVAPNVPAMCELHFAIPMSSAILNTINLRLDARNISLLLQHSESKLVFVDHQSRSLVLEAISMFPLNCKRPNLVLIPDDHENAWLHENEHDHILYEKLVEEGEPGFDWVRPESEWEPITLNYTSGTTSSPKGVVHSHRGAFLMALNSLFDWSVPKQPVYLWTLPMFHANGWSYAWAMAAVGATNVCLRRIDAPSIHEAIHRYY